MTMNDICRQINCKHIKWSNGGGDSCTCWLECKLKKKKLQTIYIVLNAKTEYRKGVRRNDFIIQIITNYLLE